MPEYILHKVKKGETVWELSRKYGVEEHKIVQANPDKIKLVKQGRNYTPVIYEGDILRIPQQNEERVSYMIQGKNSLGMGESAEYELVDSKGNVPHYPSEKITWEFYLEEGDENWRKLRLEKEKTGQKFTIIFTNQKLKSKKVRIEAYLKRQDSKEKLAEFFMVLDGEDIPEIKKLELLDANRNKIKRKLSYAETVYARAQCTGMEGETLYFSLWEDDAAGAGHSKENEENFIITKQAEVVNGLAEVSFSLIYSTMAPIANKKVPKGQKDEGKYHEYYVTVTRYEATEPEKSSENMDVNNPDYTPPPPKPKPQPKKKEQPKAPAKKPQVIHKDKVNAPAKSPASAWKEPKIIKVYFRDGNGNEWTRRPKYGEKMRIYIESENMVNRKIKVKIYDKDTVTNDLLHEEDRTISGSPSFHTISLTKAMQDKGGDAWYQNIFAEVSLYETQQKVKSEVIDVDKTDFSVPKPEGKKVVTRNAQKKKDEEKENKKCVCEERVRAYMRMLRVGEGTEGSMGYKKLFGGKYFTESPHNKTMSDHPNILVYWYTKKNGDKVYSSAAGAYQVMGYTWKDADMVSKRKKYKITDFTSESQDRFCVVLFKDKRKGMLNLITQGEIKEATEIYGSYEWASLPPGRYGQPNKTMKEALDLYKKFFKEELEGKSDLHIKKGFLKEFGHICNCNDEKNNNSSWVNPLSIMELRGWYGTGYNDWDTSASKFGKIPRRTSGIHQGIDLWAKEGTEAKACVDGKIVFNGTVGDYGLVIILEGKYEGTTYYFTYAHMKSFAYKKDDVKAGELIGYTGKSGNAKNFPQKAQHLHFEVRTKKSPARGLQDRLDPIKTISELISIEKNAKKDTQK